MSLSILNVGSGDTKLSFDPEKPEELERTKRVVTDMLAMGYAIIVRDGEGWRRATGFDPNTCEYLIADVPQSVAQAQPVPKAKRGRPRRVAAGSTKAVSVARSAGGMSAATDSIEMQNIERFDPCADVRNRIRLLAEHAGEWAGIPLPLEGEDLIVEPKYRAAAALASKAAVANAEEIREERQRIRNEFYSANKRALVVIWNEPDGRIEWGLEHHLNHFALDLHTMGVSDAWGIEQEARAVHTLAELLPHHAFKKYMLTGMFIERSKRSGVYYFFRRLKPTIAASASTGEMKILAVLCAHPIAYYRNTWAGAMAPTDDVIASLMMMRGDEHMMWKRANQHPAWRREAGL